MKNLAESIELSFINGNGFCKIYDLNNMKSKTFINFYSDGKIYIQNQLNICLVLTILMEHAKMSGIWRFNRY